IQSPGDENNGHSQNLSVSAVMESNITRISNFVQRDWTRQLGVEGQQWFTGAVLTNGGGTLELAGSSINNSNQIARDGYYFTSDINIPLVASGCTIIADSITVDTLNEVPGTINFDTIQIWPEFTNLNDDSFDLFERDLCSNPCVDSNTTVIDSNIVIDETTYFSGRYYVAPNTIITVKTDVLLDLTNVDMIFDECSGIVVHGRIRANNSVFRPCDELRTWIGIRFTDSSENNQINECLFKNAEAALAFNLSDNPKINSNTFINCKSGIYTVESSFKNPIANNNFAYDNVFENLSFCDSLGQAYVAAIFVDQNSAMLTEIKGNHFVNNGSNTTEHIGIVSSMSIIEAISGNYFSDMSKGVYFNQIVGFEEFMKINNNEFERQIFRDRVVGSQIHLDECRSPIEIESNILKANTPSTEYGIELFQSDLINVHENQVEGFTIGIVANHTNDCSILNNRVTESEEIGIAIESCTNTYVKCNVVDMNHQITGIFNDQSDMTSIESNCVFDSKYAIVIGNGCSNTSILNNYLYNYTANGVYNAGEPVLNIGLNPVHGQNTFWSNSAAAVDVFTAGGFTTNLYNNFGVAAISANTFILGPASVNSTTSCGHQIYNLAGSPQGLIYDCRPFEAHESVILDKDIADILSGLPVPGPAAIDYYNSVHRSNPGAADQFYRDVLKKQLLSENSLQWFKANHFKANKNYTDWLETVKAIQVETPLEEAQKVTEMLMAQYYLGALDVNRLGLSEIEMVKNAYQERPETNTLGLFLLRNGLNGRVVSGAIDHKEPTVDSRAVITTIDAKTMQVFPNPVGEDLNLTYSFMADEPITVSVLNILGVVQLEQNLNAHAGMLTLNVSDLVAGTYVVSITQGDHVESKTFLKQ
ncbi:MAG: right-handed parallel beta-helix repeat-containing protein, partial [Bacteroidia bacterium]|nr:right-handed parallel beta-helix repeat-containing protein [Bacteroidia bacterium]